MAVTLVNTTTVGTSASIGSGLNTFTFPLTAVPASGNLLLIMSGGHEDVGSPMTYTSLGSGAIIYQQTTTGGGHPDTTAFGFLRVPSVAIPSTLTITLSGGNAFSLAAIVHEFAGVNISQPIDVFSATSFPGNNALTGNITPIGTGDMFVGFGYESIGLRTIPASAAFLSPQYNATSSSAVGAKSGMMQAGTNATAVSSVGLAAGHNAYAILVKGGAGNNFTRSLSDSLTTTAMVSGGRAILRNLLDNFFTVDFLSGAKVGNLAQLTVTSQIDVYMGDGRAGYVLNGSICNAYINQYIYVQFQERLVPPNYLPDPTYLPFQTLTLKAKNALDSDISNVTYNMSDMLLQNDGSILTKRTVILGIFDPSDGQFHSMWDIHLPIPTNTIPLGNLSSF